MGRSVTGKKVGYLQGHSNKLQAPGYHPIPITKKYALPEDMGIIFPLNADSR
jgi:hypothetical protein